MRAVALSLLMMASSVALADHTKEDAQATTAKLEAILHPPKPKHRIKPQAQAEAQAQPQAQPQPQPQPQLVVDPLYALIVHAMSIPFDAREREAHLRDIPKNAKELDAHLRRLDAALSAKHATRD
jgi:hypothetical protein